MRIYQTILFISIFGFLVGCASNIEKRRLYTLERMRYSASGESERRHITISNAVFQSTVESLKNPCVVEAVLLPGNPSKTNGAIFFYWLCVSPTADGVRVLVQDGSMVEIPIQQGYLDENRNISKNMVLFDAVVHQSDMESIWPRLVSTGGQITLMTNGKSISNTFTLRVLTKSKTPSNPAQDRK